MSAEDSIAEIKRMLGQMQWSADARQRGACVTEVNAGRLAKVLPFRPVSQLNTPAKQVVKFGRGAPDDLIH